MAMAGDERAQSVPLSARGEANPSLLGLSQVARSPKWSFYGRHPPQRTMDAPGPGAYSHMADNTSRYSKAPQYAFSMSSREPNSKGRVPGPGAYSTAASRAVGTGISYSLTPRRREKAPATKELPGPGAHDIRSTIGNGPKWSHSPRTGSLTKGLQPGPGDYDQIDLAVAEKQPRWGFGTSKRPDTTSNIHMSTPGPGAYMSNAGLGEGPKYSMKARLTGPRPQPSPGPGAHGGHYSTFG